MGKKKNSMSLINELNESIDALKTTHFHPSQMRKPKVCIFTTFYRWDSGYSLTNVVYDQIIAHHKNGYTVVLFVLESFTDFDKVPSGITVRAVIPQIMLEPYAGTGYPDTIDEDVLRVKEVLLKETKDIDVMITHDIMFIDTYLPYNMALRSANLPCRFFHWIHSAPSPRQELHNNPHAMRYTMPRNSKLVYLNHDKVIPLAEMYGGWMKDVRVIPNSRDPRTFWNLSPFVVSLIEKYDILSADIISVYPVSATRMVDGKQIDVIIRIHEELRKLGYSTRLIIPNAHANGEHEKALVKERTTPYVIFTSNEGNGAYEHGVDSSIVSELFRLSNVFIFPSISENCSMILLEAMLSGNLIVLNKDCSGFQEFGGKDAIYFKMGNIDMGIRNDEMALQKKEYYVDMAKIIASEFENSKPLQEKRKVFKEHNYDAIFKKIESLYYEL